MLFCIPAVEICTSALTQKIPVSTARTLKKMLISYLFCSKVEPLLSTFMCSFIRGNFYFNLVTIKLKNN